MDEFMEEMTEKIQTKKVSLKTVLLIVAMVVLCVVLLLVQNAVMEKKAAKMVDKAWEEATEKANSEQEKIIVSPQITITKSVIQEVIAPARELVACKYYYTDADVYEKNHKFFDSDIVVPFTTEKTVYTYTGVISAGITFDNIDIEIIEKKTNGSSEGLPSQDIVIKLPVPSVLSNEINTDKCQFFDVKTSIFTRTSLADYSDLVSALKKTQEEKLMGKSEFWNEVKKSTEDTIRTLLTSSEQAKDCAVEFEWAENNSQTLES